jgi:hypothetical protein
MNAFNTTPNILAHVAPRDVTPADLDMLDAAVSWGWDGSTLTDYARAIWSGQSELWRAGPGVVLTTVLPSCLFIDLCAGPPRAMLPLAGAIGLDLRALARRHGRDAIECSSRRDGMTRALSAIGFAPLATYYRMEV